MSVTLKNKYSKIHSLRKKEATELYNNYIYGKESNSFYIITVVQRIDRRSPRIHNGILTVVSSGVGNGNSGVFVRNRTVICE